MMQAVNENEQSFTDSKVKTEFSFSFGQLLYLPAKRLFDIILSTVLLVILLPLFLVISILVLLQKDGPVFFKQKRIGKNGKIIKIYKFRSMSSAAPPEIATAEFADSDMYITKIGKFLRRTSIDELPQFFNVLKGDLSIVGPRPFILCEMDIHIMRNKMGVYAIRPGITGLAQVNGRDLLTSIEKVRYDELYLKRFNAFLDLNILLRSIFIVLTHRGFIEGHQTTRIYTLPRINAANQPNIAYIHNAEDSDKKEKEPLKFTVGRK